MHQPTPVEIKGRRLRWGAYRLRQAASAAGTGLHRGLADRLGSYETALTRSGNTEPSFRPCASIEGAGEAVNTVDVATGAGQRSETDQPKLLAMQRRQGRQGAGSCTGRRAGGTVRDSRRIWSTPYLSSDCSGMKPWCSVSATSTAGAFSSRCRALGTQLLLLRRLKQ